MSKIRAASLKLTAQPHPVMTVNFDKYAQTGREFVSKIAFELGDESNTSKASRILRSTLHVLRAQSTPEESLQLISQLPMFIKALYVDGWKIGSSKGRVRHLDDFVAEMHKTHQQAYHKDDLNDFTDKEDCTRAIEAVFRVIKDYVSEGEIEDFRRTLPEGLRELIEA